jgi:hypothetical protein
VQEAVKFPFGCVANHVKRCQNMLIPQNIVNKILTI